MTRRACWLLAAVAAAAGCGGVAQAQTVDPAPDSVQLVPGTHYRAGWLHRWLLGKHHRDLWTHPVTVEVLDPARFAGGLTPECRGGGFQTASLRFRGADGRRYVFRSADKDPTRALLPEVLHRTPAAELLQDQISSHHPAGALVVAPLLEATGVLHVEPSLRVMADRPELGEFHRQFAGMLGTIEERPSRGFASADELEGSEEVWARIEKSSADRVDARAYLGARLIDILVGDWDRHFDQWTWAGYAIGAGRIWHPIPRDRDQAFARLDGVVLAAARLWVPQLVSFGTAYPDMYGLTWSARALDRRLLVGLEKPVWDSVTQAVQARLQDEVLERAVERLPSEMRQRTATALLAALKRRRDDLSLAANAFYPLVSEFADVRATDEDDIAEIERLDDARVLVRLAPAIAPAQPYFTRTFVVGETREIRVYLAGGDDRAIVRGTALNSAVVRVVGGNGRDVLIDSSRVGPSILRGITTSTFLYDSDGEDRLEGGPGTEIERARFRPPPRKDVYPPRPPGACGGAGSDTPPRDLGDPFKDWGSRWLPAPFFAFQPNLGLLVGVGADRYGYGFRKAPYGSRVSLRAVISTGPGQLRAWYEGDFRNLPRGLWASVNARYSGIDFVRFHGLGNETVLVPDVIYTLRQRQVSAAASVTAFHLRSRITIGPVFEFARTELGTGSLVDSLRPYGAEGFAQLGLQARLAVDTRDRAFAPRTGVHLVAESRLVPRILDVTGLYGSARGEASTYLSLGDPARVTLALRTGGMKVWGDAPFHAAAYAGGASTLRGYDERRFGGDAAAYGNAEARLFLTRFSVVLPGEFGIMGLGDVGRVYLKGQRSDRWHSAVGGGLWVAFIERASTVTLTAARSPERWAFYVGMGFMY